jgi:DNA-binding MarR family transcriptional regulator
VANTTLLHQLFPIVRAEVLGCCSRTPGQEPYVRELARLAFLSLQTVQAELAKLEAADLVSSRSNGYQRFYRANPKHPLYRTFAEARHRCRLAS